VKNLSLEDGLSELGMSENEQVESGKAETKLPQNLMRETAKLHSDNSTRNLDIKMKEAAKSQVCSPGKRQV